MSEWNKAIEAWTEIPESDSYKGLTDRKTKHIVDRGYHVIGYVLAKDKDYCVSVHSAVRWINPDELFAFLHPTTNACAEVDAARYRWLREWNRNGGVDLDAGVDSMIEQFGDAIK